MKAAGILQVDHLIWLICFLICLTTLRDSPPDECPKMLDKSVKKRPHPSLEKIQESVELLWIGTAYLDVSAGDGLLRIELS